MLVLKILDNVGLSRSTLKESHKNCEECYDEKDERAIVFDEPFKRTPRTFVASNGIKMESGKSMSLHVKISKQSVKGFSWTCEAPPGVRIDVDWIAFG